MSDERLTYEPLIEGGKHYILAIVSTPHGEAGGNRIMADGQTHREAAEALVSKLLDTFEWVWDEWTQTRTRAEAAEAAVEGGGDE